MSVCTLTTFCYATGFNYDQCLDVVEVELDYQVHTRCGYAKSPSALSYCGYVLAQFSSNQGCQNYGYSIWAQCIPVYSQLSSKRHQEYKRIVDTKVSLLLGCMMSIFICDCTKMRTSSATVINHSRLIIKNPPIQEFQANYSTIIKYDNSEVIIRSADMKVLAHVNSIDTLHVYNRHGILIETHQSHSNETMYGYGMLYV